MKDLNNIYYWVALVVKQRRIKDKNEIDCLLQVAKSCRSPNSFFSAISQLYKIQPENLDTIKEEKKEIITIKEYDNTLSTFSKTTLSELDNDDTKEQELHS